MVQLFSIPAFFIVLREVLEACLVVGIALAYLNKVGATQYRRWVWIGAGLGILCSLAIGLGFGIAYFVSDEQLFDDTAEKIFEGVTFLVAAVLLTWMIIWMMMMGKELQAKMESRLDDIIEQDEKSARSRAVSIFLMVFFQVLREGIETVIFLISANNVDDDDSWEEIPIPGVLALITGLVISYLVFRGLVNLDIQKFFFFSSFLLMAFAAGLVSHAFHELQEVDLFGDWDRKERHWYNAVMWSTEECCHDKENEFFAMLRALFGYQDTPTFVEWITYFAYWLIVIVIFIVINWSYIRSTRSKVAAHAQNISLVSLLFTFVGFVFTLINVTWIGTTSMVLAFLLSVLSVILLFDTVVDLLPVFKKPRRSLLLWVGISMGALTMFMFVMHLVEMGCEGGDGDCSLEFFFFFGLIFRPGYSSLGRDVENSRWPAIAVLSFSIILTVFFFGFMSFLLVLASFNVDEEGNYIYDDAVNVKGGEEEEEDSATEMDGFPQGAAMAHV